MKKYANHDRCKMVQKVSDMCNVSFSAWDPTCRLFLVWVSELVVKKKINVYSLEDLTSFLSNVTGPPKSTTDGDNGIHTPID